MLEKPEVAEKRLVACLRREYALQSVHLTFLPLGADVNTAVYHVLTSDEPRFFLKLRSGNFGRTAVSVPAYLSRQGIAQIIPVIVTRGGKLWTTLGEFKVILYPFIEGRDGYETRLSEQHWDELGRALKQIHTLTAPATLTEGIPRETYSPRWRGMVRDFVEGVRKHVMDDPVAAEVARLLRDRRCEILDLVGRAERLADILRAQPQELVICHSDLHAGNLHLSNDGALYLVDWDTVSLAPKERDLMYIGGGLLGNWYSPAEEETFFFRSYGQTQINEVASAYYRYERIVQDIAAFCSQLLSTTAGGEDREQGLQYLKSNFQPDGTIAIAYQSDKTRLHS